jgi:hypothetical protein
MCTVSSIHELILQCKICYLAFPEAVANDIGGMDGKNRIDNIQLRSILQGVIAVTLSGVSRASSA